VMVVNDTGERVSGAVTVETRDDALTDESLDVTVDPHETATAGDVSVPADAASVTLSFTTDDRAVTNRYYM
jgi:hypothetical protein